MDRRRVLELFEKQKDFMEEKVKSGIERYRKGWAKFTVTDENGRPLSGVKIRVRQKSHEFKFGANLFMLDEMETKEKNEAYKRYFADLFNMATLPFYWSSTEPEQGKTRYAKDSPELYRRPPIDRCMEFCTKYGIEPREHALAYEHWFPDWLSEASVFEVKAAFEKRCEEIATRYRKSIRTIEVTNEMEWPSGRTAFYEEPDFVEWCFKTAEKYFPANQLSINEHTVAAWGDRGNPCDKYYSYIKAALLSGARIDAIGMQYHMFYRAEEEYQNTRCYYNPEKLYKHMDLYAQFGKPLQVTEVTIPAYSWQEEDEAIQAEILEKLYTLWFSHPSMEQIIYWNLVDGYAHPGDENFKKKRLLQGDMTVGENYFYGGLLRFDLTPKPAYYTIKRLIDEVWHTEDEIMTDSDGNAHFYGFYGTYDVEITLSDKTVKKEISLTKKGKNEFRVRSEEQ